MLEYDPFLKDIIFRISSFFKIYYVTKNKNRKITMSSKTVKIKNQQYLKNNYKRHKNKKQH